MSRKPKTKVANEEVTIEPIETVEPASEPIVTGAPEITEPTPTAPAKVQFDVYNAQGTFMRSYLVDNHGDEAETLAKEYASKIGGRIV